VERRPAFVLFIIIGIAFGYSILLISQPIQNQGMIPVSLLINANFDFDDSQDIWESEWDLNPLAAQLVNLQPLIAIFGIYFGIGVVVLTSEWLERKRFSNERKEITGLSHDDPDEFTKWFKSEVRDADDKLSRRLNAEALTDYTHLLSILRRHYSILKSTLGAEYNNTREKLEARSMSVISDTNTRNISKVALITTFGSIGGIFGSFTIYFLIIQNQPMNPYIIFVFIGLIVATGIGVGCFPSWSNLYDTVRIPVTFLTVLVGSVIGIWLVYYVFMPYALYSNGSNSQLAVILQASNIVSIAASFSSWIINNLFKRQRENRLIQDLILKANNLSSDQNYQKAFAFFSLSLERISERLERKSRFGNNKILDFRFEVEAQTASLPQDLRLLDTRLEIASSDRITVLRGCEIIGGKFEYKVKVSNDTNFVITNVTVTIAGYPRDSIDLVGETTRSVLRIETDGFRSLQFVFIPTNDCVEGRILSTVTYMDSKNQVHTLEAQSYTIRSVCDLLKPLLISTEHLNQSLAQLESTSHNQILEWNPIALYKMTKLLLPKKNFHLIDSDERLAGGQFIGKLRGIAVGKYTKKKLAVVVLISGEENASQATLEIEVLGDDLAMLPITIHELVDGLTSWVCLSCGAHLMPEYVTLLKSGVTIECDYCKKQINIASYQRA